MDPIKSFLEKYGLKNIDFMNRIAAPLLTHYGYDHFWHYRIDAEGSFFYSGNQPDAMLKYLDLDLHRTNILFCHPKFYYPMHLIEKSVYQPEALKKREKQRHDFGYYNHFIIIRKPTPNIIEGFGFASRSDDPKILEAPTYSPEVFEAFVNYYLEEGKKVRDHLYQNRVSVLDFYGDRFTAQTDIHKRLELFNQKRRQFLTAIAPGTSVPLDALTMREKECILYYLQGFTAEETGKKLFISKRTVESHFDNVKQKLNLEEKRQLHQKVDPLLLF